MGTHKLQALDISLFQDCWRRLNNVGLNPKINISSKFVTKVDIIEIFDLDCESLKTMNPHLNLTPRENLWSFIGKYMAQQWTFCVSFQKLHCTSERWGNELGKINNF